MATRDIGARLQHPRRSLGNRHRSQAEKFLKLVESDSSNLHWAEQSARQAVLHDFTHPDNWRILLQTKVAASDADGIRSILDELFLILGRDPELLLQLDGLDMVDQGSDLLEAAIIVDPLDPDAWWTGIDDSEALEAFLSRVRSLDFTDPRANILFSRRMERLLDNGHEDEYLELTRKLLAQRPSNHEVWSRMGRLHERRQEHDQAWFCYDQAQTNMPALKVRDEFKERMEAKIDGKSVRPWRAPDIDDRIEFLRRMQILAIPAYQDATESSATTPDQAKESEIDRAKRLHGSSRSSEAFFLARRLAAEGDEQALTLVEQIRREMDDE
jgi:tetratricopeptide (TPR) repeat protein